MISVGCTGFRIFSTAWPTICNEKTQITYVLAFFEIKIKLKRPATASGIIAYSFFSLPNNRIKSFHYGIQQCSLLATEQSIFSLNYFKRCKKIVR
jgi:hypothetical protein